MPESTLEEKLKDYQIYTAASLLLLSRYSRDAIIDNIGWGLVTAIFAVCMAFSHHPILAIMNVICAGYKFSSAMKEYEWYKRIELQIDKNNSPSEE